MKKENIVRRILPALLLCLCLTAPARADGGLFQGETANTAEAPSVQTSMQAAVFASEAYSVSVQQSTGGTLTVSPSGSSVPAGTTLTIKAAPQAGYALSRLLYSGKNEYEEEITVTSGVNTYTLSMPTSAITIRAVFTKSCGITVCGTEVTDANCNAILGEGNSSLRYDASTNTLTFVNASVNGDIVLNTSSPVTLCLIGDENVLYGSLTSASSLTVTSFNGSAKLSVSGSISLSGGAGMTLASGTALSVSSGISAESGTIAVYGSLTSSGGDTANSCGIRCGSLAVKTLSSASGGSVYAYGGNSYSGSQSIGIEAGSISVEYQALLSAVSGGSAGISRAVSAVSISNAGTLTASAGSASSESTGIFCSGSLLSSGTLSASGAGAGKSCGISSASVSFAGGEASASASLAASESYGIYSSSVTVSGGVICCEGGSRAMSSVPSFSGYSPRLFVSDLTSTEAEADPAVLSNYQARHVSLQPKQEEAAESVTIERICFDQETVTLSTLYGMRTVRYWFYPTEPSNPNLTWTCSDTEGKTVKVVVDEEQREFSITALGNGTAYIYATAKDGSAVQACCRVTVSGIGSNNVSYMFDYRDNDGTWYADYSDSFTVRCTGPSGELQGIYVDGAYVPQYTGSQLNWTFSSTSENKTLVTFTHAYMASLARGSHQLRFSYSSVSTVLTSFTVCSIYDPPRTGDESSGRPLLLFLLSGAGSAGMLLILKKKERCYGIQ